MFAQKVHMKCQSLHMDLNIVNTLEANVVDFNSTEGSINSGLHVDISGNGFIWVMQWNHTNCLYRLKT